MAGARAEVVTGRDDRLLRRANVSVDLAVTDPQVRDALGDLAGARLTLTLEVTEPQPAGRGGRALAGLPACPVDKSVHRLQSTGSWRPSRRSWARWACPLVLVAVLVMAAGRRCRRRRPPLPRTTWRRPRGGPTGRPAELAEAEEELALAQDAVAHVQTRVDTVDARVGAAREQVRDLAIRLYVEGTVPVIRILRMADANDVIRAQQYSHVVAGGSTDSLRAVPGRPGGPAAGAGGPRASSRSPTPSRWRT